LDETPQKLKRQNFTTALYRPILKLGSQCNQDSGILGQGSTFFVREILDGIGAKPGGAHIHYFMLLRGVPPTQKHVVMKKFKSKYICNENIQDYELQV
jgi:hypothetical protein